MTTEDDFWRAIDADPSDWQTLLVFADWLADRGIDCHLGLRAMVAIQVQPCHANCGIFESESLELWSIVSPRIFHVYWWANEKSGPGKYRDLYRPFSLPDPWFDKQRQFWNEWLRVGGYPNRREAYYGAAKAFNLLRPDLQEQYLKGVYSRE